MVLKTSMYFTVDISIVPPDRITTAQTSLCVSDQRKFTFFIVSAASYRTVSERVDSTHTRHHCLQLFNPLPTAKKYISQRQINHMFSHLRFYRFSFSQAIMSFLPSLPMLSYPRYFKGAFLVLHSNDTLLLRAF